MVIKKRKALYKKAAIKSEVVQSKEASPVCSKHSMWEVNQPPEPETSDPPLMIGEFKKSDELLKVNIQNILPVLHRKKRRLREKNQVKSLYEADM